MRIYLQTSAITLLMFCALASPTCAQAPAGGAILESIRAEGSHIPEAQIVAETGLKNGDLVTKDQLQFVAERLGQRGLFEKVIFESHIVIDGRSLLFDLNELSCMAVMFVNCLCYTS